MTKDREREREMGDVDVFNLRLNITNHCKNRVRGHGAHDSNG